MSCHGTKDAKIKNCVTTKIKSGCVDVAAKGGEPLPVHIYNNPLEVSGCVQVAPKETFPVDGCLKLTNDDTNPLSVTGCVEIDNKDCNPLCVITEENIYGKTPRHFLGDCLEVNAKTGEVSVSATGIDGTFLAQKLSVSFCLSAETQFQLRCNTVMISLSFNQTPILASVSVGLWPGTISVVDTDGFRIFVRLELDFEEVYGCPQTMKNDDIFTFSLSSGPDIDNLCITLSGCQRPCQNDCTKNFNAIVPGLTGGNKVICHCTPVNFDLTTLITNQEALDEAGAEVTFCWTVDSAMYIEGATGGSGDTITDVLKNISQGGATANYLVQSKRVFPDFECEGETAMVSILVAPELVVGLTGPRGVCPNSETTYTYTASATGGGVPLPLPFAIDAYAYTWFVDQGHVDGPNEHSYFDLNVSGRTGTLRLDVVVSDGLCTGATGIDIEIFEPPTILDFSLDMLCFNSNFNLDFAKLCYSVTGGLEPYDVNLWKKPNWDEEIPMMADNATGATGCFSVTGGNYDYFIIVIDAHGCSVQSENDISIPADCAPLT